MVKDFIKNLTVNQYFNNRMKKVYIDRCNYLGIESFKQYLDHRYRDNCYYYSAYALMGLKEDDKIMRGRIDVGQPNIFDMFAPDVNPNSNYYHGWCEFIFDGKEYVFDSMIRGIVTKEEYYEDRKPVINYEATLSEVLSYYLSSECADRVGNKKYILKKEGPYHYPYDDPTYLIWPLYKAQVIIDSGQKIKKFIANCPPSG